MTTAISKTTTAASTVNTVLTPLFATDYHVYINHTDAGGIVYHANHLVFLKTAAEIGLPIGLNGYFYKLMMVKFNTL